MSRRWRQRAGARCGLAVASVMVSLIAGSAQAADKAARNLMVLDGNNTGYVEFLDTDSLRRTGDILEFDTVSVSYSYSFSLKPGESMKLDLSDIQTRKLKVSLDTKVEHLRVSCGWRTIARPDMDAVPADLKLPPGMSPPDQEFLSPNDRLTAVVDRICSGETVTGDKSIRSVKAATARAKKLMDPPHTPSPSPAKPDPVEPGWAGGMHAFSRLDTASLEAVPADGQGLLFIDRKALKRAGSRVEGVTLLMMGNRALRYSYQSNDPVVMRKMTYDCTAGLMWVTAEARWNRYGILTLVSEISALPRARTHSPIIAAEIDSACADTPKPDAAAYANLDEAWAFARKDWPQAPAPGFDVVCLWNAMPADWRSRIRDHWATKGPDAAPLPPGATETAAHQCAVPDGERKAASQAMSLYIPQRGAVAFLNTQGIIENQLAYVFDNLPWRERQRLKKTVDANSPADRQFQADIANRMSAQLGVTTRAGAEQVFVYMMTRAGLMPD